MQDRRFRKTLPTQSRGFLRTRRTAEVENDRGNVFVIQKKCRGYENRGSAERSLQGGVTLGRQNECTLMMVWG